MESKLKLQKLTENLQHSSSYGKKLQEQVAIIGELILQTKISAVKLQEQIQQIRKTSSHIDCDLKKNQQQKSAYQYKMQKVSIRVNEYTRKVQIQQNMLDKKVSHQCHLRNKIEELENQLKSKSTLDSEIQNSKQAIEIIEKKMESQNSQIEELCTSLLLLNKKTRNKEDQVSRKLKAVQKKRQLLQNLTKQISGDDDNKENEGLNKNQTKQGSKVKTLMHQKNKIKQQLTDKINHLLQIYSLFSELSENSSSIKKNVQKSQQIFNDSKSKKVSLIRLSEMLKYEGESKK